MKVVVGIQARTNSSRLPAKVLLPIAGLPIAVLAAKRASENTDYRVVLLTSNKPSDDLLCSVVAQYGIEFYRGNLDNVLARYVDAFKDEGDDCIVVRLTADNVIPDGEFIRDVVNEYTVRDVEYLAANGDKCGLPYGMSAEVMRLGALREALRNTDDKYDIEHVTPYVRRTVGVSYFSSYKEKNFPAGRCTIDNLDDYFHVNKLFESVRDPVLQSSETLLKRLSVFNAAPQSKLSVGTVQMGLDYGINNLDGRLSLDESHELLSSAARAGVKYIDTARAYGDSESVIGKWLDNGWRARIKIITKLAPFEIDNSWSNRELKLRVVNSVYESCRLLRQGQLDVLMLHRASHMLIRDGLVMDVLRELQMEGVIGELGVSVQSPQELQVALSGEFVAHIQMPFNVLDGRWSSLIPEICRVQGERPLTMHVRSIFLQGLLLTSDTSKWEKANARGLGDVRIALVRLAERLGLNSLYELCLAYVQAQGWVGSIVVGFDSYKQFQQALEATSGLECDFDKLTAEVSKLQIKQESVLNPVNWSS